MLHFHTITNYNKLSKKCQPATSSNLTKYAYWPDRISKQQIYKRFNESLQVTELRPPYLVFSIWLIFGIIKLLMNPSFVL